MADWERTIEFKKRDDEERLVFGWLSVVTDANGAPIVDSQGDVIEPADLEKAAYGFVLDSRRADVMHSERPVARLVESTYIDKAKLEAMGVPLAKDVGVQTGWWVGFKVEDDEVWKRIKAGELKAFSIGGIGRRMPMPAAA